MMSAVVAFSDTESQSCGNDSHPLPKALGRGIAVGSRVPMRRHARRMHRVHLIHDVCARKTYLTGALISQR